MCIFPTADNPITQLFNPSKNNTLKSLTISFRGDVSYGGKYYYMGSNGKVVTNKWIQYGDVWYHVGASGAVDNSWRG